MPTQVQHKFSRLPSGHGSLRHVSVSSRRHSCVTGATGALLSCDPHWPIHHPWEAVTKGLGMVAAWLGGDGWSRTCGNMVRGVDVLFGAC